MFRDMFKKYVFRIYVWIIRKEACFLLGFIEMIEYRFGVVGSYLFFSFLVNNSWLNNYYMVYVFVGIRDIEIKDMILFFRFLLLIGEVNKVN